MAVARCLSTPADRNAITDLLDGALQIPKRDSTLDPEFRHWKYWGPHTLAPKSRSQMIKDGPLLVAHGSVWPIRLKVPDGSLPAFKLCDWVAKPGVPGAGMQVLRGCGSGMAAAFAIGGTSASRDILRAAGFKDYNSMSFCERPLRPVRLALKSLRNWKLPARVVRNAAWSLFSPVHLPADWKISAVEPAAIPDSLWPGETAGQAVSQRSAELLSHMMACPIVRGSHCYVLRRDGKPVAYALLIRVSDEVRLADYGPAGLDVENGRMLGISA